MNRNVLLPEKHIFTICNFRDHLFIPYKFNTSKIIVKTFSESTESLVIPTSKSDKKYLTIYYMMDKNEELHKLKTIYIIFIL